MGQTEYRPDIGLFTGGHDLPKRPKTALNIVLNLKLGVGVRSKGYFGIYSNRVSNFVGILRLNCHCFLV